MPSAVEETSADAPVPPVSTNRAALNKEDAELVDDINAVVDRMRTVTSQDPYLLTIPQDVEPRYHHAYHYHAYQYMHNTPFDQGDHESIQYQTFHFHEPGKDMFVLHNTRRDDGPQEADRPKVAKVGGTGANTPNVKKMSLNAYKKKQAGNTPTADTRVASDTAAKQAAVKGPIERVKESEQVLASLADHEALVAEKSDGQDLKRKHESNDEQADKSGASAPAAKRPRKASPEPGPAESPKKQTQPPANVKAARLPPRKADSPVSRPVEADLPPRLSPLQVEALPARLSPTLPENISASLKAREKINNKGKVAKDKTAPLDMDKPTKATSSPRRYDSHVGSSPHLASRVKSPAPDGSQHEEIAVGRPSGKARSDAKPSLIVKLNYKKTNRKMMREFLRLPPKRWSKLHMTAKGIDIDSISDEGLPQASQRAHQRMETRPGADTGSANAREPSKPTLVKAKGSNGAPTKHGPTTPPPRVTSPVLAKTSAQVTPGLRKEAASVAMRREQSNDSNMNTPSGQSNHTPATQTNGAMKAPSSQPSTKTPMQQAWEQEQKLLDPLGRGLKHAATDHLANAGAGVVSESTKKVAAIKSVESMLCYVFAFTCAEEAARAADPKGTPPLRLWRSLPPFLNFVRKYCDKYPALIGIACLLAVTVNARIIEIGYQKSGEPLPPDKVLEVNAAMQKAALESEEALNLDAIMDLFPKAWAARAKGSGIVSSKPRGPGKLGGPYKIPIGLHTPPLLAARACYAMLDEWVRNQKGLDYRLSLKLEG